MRFLLAYPTPVWYIANTVETGMHSGTKIMDHTMTTHEKEIINLRKVEGQLHGIIAMIEDGRYCIDILHQLFAARSALSRITLRILENHVRGCVVRTMGSTSAGEREKKIRELIDVLAKFGGGRK